MLQGHSDAWAEGFLRAVVVKLKRERNTGGGGVNGIKPWATAERRCERYHVHDVWAPSCEGVDRVVKGE